VSAALTRLGLPGEEKSWAALGFAITAGRFRIGEIECTVNTAPSWGFDGTSADPAVLEIPELLPHATDRGAARAGTADAPHPNAVSFIDHVVYWVPDLDAAITALNSVLGAEPRRRFHPRGPAGPEMAFYRAGAAVLEVVASGKPASLPGIAFGTTDLDATVAAVHAAGGPVGEPKAAVQGGRIASVWHGHLNWRIAFYEPAPR
jgi:catechol 2,3-dioxygenase-like lactoylglutathione lyase family enzyme